MLSYEKHLAEQQKKLIEKRKKALERALDSYKSADGMNFELRMCDGYMQDDALRIALSLDTYAIHRFANSLDDMIKHAERLRDACEQFVKELRSCQEDFRNPEIENEENETTKEVAVLEIA